MPTDPQSLLDQARCLECAGSSDYGLDLIEVALLAKWAKATGGGGGGGCVPPAAPAILLETDSPSTVGIFLTLPIPNPTTGVIVKWGTTPGGPYPNSKSFALTGVNGQGPYNITTSDGLLTGTTYDFIAFSDNGNGCVSLTSSGEVQGTPQTSNLNAEWQTRVTASGGGNASNNTYNANDAFVAALAAAGITSKVKIANLIAPDSLAAAFTPLIQGPGFATWNQAGTVFVAGDLTINGLVGGNLKYLNPGFLPSAFMTLSSFHGAVYTATDETTSSGYEYGCLDAAGGGGNQLGLITHNGDLNTYGYSSNALGGMIGNLGLGAGYWCMSRSAAARADVYFATSVNAHASRLNDVTVNVTNPPSTNGLWTFSLNNAGAIQRYTTKRISAFTFGLGLSAAESLALFNAIQAYRQKIGGGFI